MFEKSDEHLIQKALKGNKKAWFTLIKRYESSVYHYGVRMTGNAHDAADLMQDIFMSVFRSLENFRAEGSFKSWLFRVAHYRCIEFYRRWRPEQGLEDVPEPVSTAPCPEGEILSDHVSKALTRAMQNLPLTQKAVIELKFFGQFTFDEIAQQMGLSPNTVKSRLYSALSKLKLDLEVENV
ncbi:sigma-70 family RNA polymerase sigma factor [Alteromonas aestuariivivens]|uniref:Sigma-70 family RNA polymerase sigma factor n=1 Tax=Alteromonas aestuariivivens TaxID=1938339 RepID=A0A3D8MCA6_9ALTE|nr:sigma-70 family RNA polymerase sigma factor [Alteromonas aestuariivivens]RDV28154.1 sigma-70 family RNA polymerase sigma factor [Alteromonas aestuariivivens]